MKKRLFIGVDISDEVREAAASYISEVTHCFPDASVKWELSEKLHLTLKFLGSADEALIDRVKTLVTRTAELTVPFEIEVGGTGAFPSARSPRVLWIGVNDESGSLKQLAKNIDTECEGLGFEAEKRSFKAHLTLARIRDPRNAGRLGEVHIKNSFGPLKSSCSELVLYQSLLGSSGSTYRKLLRLPFGSE